MLFQVSAISTCTLSCSMCSLCCRDWYDGAEGCLLHTVLSPCPPPLRLGSAHVCGGVGPVISASRNFFLCLKLMLSFMDRWVWVQGWETRGFAFNNDKDLFKMSAGGIMCVHCSQYKPCLIGTSVADTPHSCVLETAVGRTSGVTVIIESTWWRSACSHWGQVAYWVYRWC